MVEAGLSSGERIAHFRRRRGMSQDTLAGLVGMSESMVSKIERGIRGVDKLSTLMRFASVLHVRLWDLVDQPGAQNGQRGHASLAGIRVALRDLEPAGEPVRPAELSSRVGMAWSAWHESRSRFSVVGPMLADLVRDCERTMRLGDADASRAAARDAVLVYRLCRSFLKRVGAHKLLSGVAERGRMAAMNADDPASAAIADHSYAMTLSALEDFEGSVEVGVRAAERLERHLPDDSGLLSVYGDLSLTSAHDAAILGDGATADRWLRQADLAASRLGADRDDYWMAFGPANVAIHRVVVELEQHRPADALHVSRTVDASTCPSVERRATHMIEVANCYVLTGNDEGALISMQVADRESPEDVRYDPLGRQVVRSLLRRGKLRSFRTELERIARNNGVLD